ncbi:endonuclease/exonuclease/phosphatase family protein [Cereibacter sphaeroides]|nr:endonuclease/exonuclease/phosphatase family protein [Cereibacter sphaeroides]
MASAQTLRLAVFHTDLGRDGPGLLLADIRREEADILRVRDALVQVQPDVVLLLDFDYDYADRALGAFTDILAEGGLPLPHIYAPRPNTGLATGLDLDGDGRRNEGDDAQGWGRFPGAGGMALLSRWPIEAAQAEDFSAFLWRDLPGNRYPQRDGQPYPSPEAQAIQRLSSTGHWRVPVDTPYGSLTLLTWHAGPPVFGGPYQRNFHRNHDETAFWLWHLDQRAPDSFVLLGGANLDPENGDGDHALMARLLADPRLQDAAPHAAGQDGADSSASAHWPDGPGALRTEYLLPSAGIIVERSGLLWPGPDAGHALVWADLRLTD